MSTLTQEQIDQLIKEQIGPNALAPEPQNPETATALANLVATTTAVVQRLNQDEISRYLTGFQNWSALVLAGKIPNTDPPQPPGAYAALAATNKWTYIVKTSDPVVAMPPIPSVPQVPIGMVVAVGSFLTTSPKGEKFFSALPTNANVPNGFTTQATSADGVAGTFMWVAFPFGGWWEQIAPAPAAPAA